MSRFSHFCVIQLSVRESSPPQITLQRWSNVGPTSATPLGQRRFTTLGQRPFVIWLDVGPTLAKVQRWPYGGPTLAWMQRWSHRGPTLAHWMIGHCWATVGPPLVNRVMLELQYCHYVMTCSAGKWSTLLKQLLTPLGCTFPKAATLSWSPFVDMENWITFRCTGPGSLSAFIKIWNRLFWLHRWLY